MKKVWSVLLTMVLLLACFPLCVSAETIYEEGDYRYTVSDGVATITGYLGQGEGVDLVIPDTLGGNPVVAIGENAFESSRGLSSVTVNVATIGSLAFGWCEFMTTVIIGEKVTSIGEYAFESCFGLTSFIVEQENPSYCSVNGVLFNKDMTTLIYYPVDKADTDYAIPDSVTTIGTTSFIYNKNLVAVTIPDSVTTIEKSAFYMCHSLDKVYYTGSEEKWYNVYIDNSNYAPNFAPRASMIYYNCINPKDHYSANVQHSVMDTENGNGLAFRFELAVDGVAVVNKTEADLANATVNYLGQTCKLVGMGAVMSNREDSDLELGNVNGITMLDVPAVYLCDLEPNSCAFAVRIINIPDANLSSVIYARPYYIIEIDGVQITLYGDIDSASCAEYM